MTRRVLFICTHNSARSQMAEAMLRAWGGPEWDSHSAGVESSFVRLEAIEAMDEIGIDINDQQSKTLERYVGQHWDFVVPVCEEGAAACPTIPGNHLVERCSSMIRLRLQGPMRSASRYSAGYATRSLRR